MKFTKIIFDILEEQKDPSILKTSTNKPIVDAIRNRKKITFFYSGPLKPKKESVKPGKRYNVEPVSMGISSTGKLIIRAWVDSNSGSITKTGYKKGNWKTFIVSRMRNLNVSKETFNIRPGYKEDGDDKMSTVYVQTSFKDKLDVKKPEKPSEKPQVEPEKVEPQVEPEKVEPQVEPEKVEPQSKELPEPKPTEKPDKTPEVEKTEPSTDKIKTQSEPTNKEELPEPKPEEKPSENPEDETEKNLQESIKRIKTLMFF